MYLKCLVHETAIHFYIFYHFYQVYFTDIPNYPAGYYQSVIILSEGSIQILGLAIAQLHWIQFVNSLFATDMSVYFALSQ